MAVYFSHTILSARHSKASADFLVGDAEFDAIDRRIRKPNLPYWADPVSKDGTKQAITTADAVSIS